MEIEPGRLDFDADGVPASPAYGDVFHSAAGGPEQARHVFLHGNGLPRRWAGRQHYAILETGFGLGLNFLATWAALRQDSSAPRRLDFFSAERHPLTRDDLQRAHQHWPALEPLARQLRAAWPPLMSGFHRLHLDGGRVTLTLLLGDALEALSRLDGCFDAIYLDGFSPSRNPHMWSPDLFAQLARLGCASATLATWSVAGEVRRGLTEAGFELDRRPGFGDKREMLVGRRSGPETGTAERAAARRAVVIGAGLAGSAVAERLAARDWSVTVLERQRTPASGASGNPAGILLPLFNLIDGPRARLSRACLLYALRHLGALADEGAPLRHQACGVLQLARDADHAARQQRIVEALALPPSVLDYVDTAAAARLCSQAVAGPGWWFESAGWVCPPDYCAANLFRHAGCVDLRLGASASRIVGANDDWTVLDERGMALACAPVVILASGYEAAQLAQAKHLPLTPVRGQVSYLPASRTRPLRVPVCREGYVTPAIDGIHCFGASFATGIGDPRPTTADHDANLARLERVLPGFAAGTDAGTLQGRVGWRTATPDRMPMVGALSPADMADTPAHVASHRRGLHVLLGLGARGMVWGQLCAELLAARINGEPLPLERELVAALEVERFVRGRRRTAPR
ncbi:MAG: bifunctional tRNA (5-methylaminomethyl-2-thiouridine)(34)-methyltransferase MnmD/FAD-dependent 5-carboxymethylaminomethyl-2-thiouridine(34) oxidoreductase MnmC [Betaproteobacteria bacterium]|nr:bifunctional tRNA (5-methylaminomethyl-2-thiouridine)(34)-methyltransferase MnmD/FAD-dependent 5-carboxymethylaminomethyl-2-thiouridine(34) oxidoreductase MnmC [Betaproteobacteria bacterium]